MTTITEDQTISVEISSDRQLASLVIHPTCPAHLINAQACLSLLKYSGIQVTSKVVEAVELFLKDAPSPDQERRALVAHASPPQHGTDGRVEFLLAGSNQPQQDEGQQKISHYDRSAYVVVKAGDIIAKIVEPTPGHDGTDVLGQTIPACPGKAVSVQFDESIAKDASGLLVAQTSGMLDLSSTKLCIRQLLEVAGYVDFSTGNIDFVGDLLVHRGVRDCFIVKATGHVEVRGLIEAATIHCGGNLTAKGGMAGRERGYLNVSGSVIGKYLDNIQGAIGQDLRIEREIINCELTVQGALRSPNCRVVGGKLIVVGPVEVDALGSAAAVTTELLLACLPNLEQLSEKLETLHQHLIKKRDRLLAEKQQLSLISAHTSTQHRERQTEVLFELHQVTCKLAQAAVVKDALADRIKQKLVLDLRVRRTIHTGVLLRINGRSFRIRKDVQGPVHITRDTTGVTVYTTEGGMTKSLAKIADVSLDPDSKSASRQQ